MARTGTGSPPDDPATLHFERFELRPGERQLLVEGRLAAIGARAFDLLVTLARQPGRLISKNELLDLVWPGLVVEEANLHVQISSLRKLLGADAIGTVPGRGYRLTVAPRPEAPSPAAPAGPTAAATIPPAAPVARSRLFGRDADLAALREGLVTPGCLTVVGPAGVGKTSLARATAGPWTGPTAWVDLTPLADGAQVAGALGRALQAMPDGDDVLGPVLRQLQALDTLLVLDNAEHVVQATAELAAALVAGAPGLHLLVTSQLPLAIAGERVQRLQPLSADEDAVALLAERITAADSRMRLTPEDRPLLQDICRHLDGLPLALEMAAARVPLLGLAGVRDALDQRFSLLTRGHRTAAQRHRTLHDAVAWSYRLLDAEEQRLFRSLGVFAGGFTLDLAVALQGGPPGGRWGVIDALAALVDRSLVTVSADDPPRYGLLETLRAYALEQLGAADADPSAHAVRERHALALVALFERHVSPGRIEAAPCLPEIDNVREAITWSRANGRLDCAAILSALVARVVTFTPWRVEAMNWLKSLQAAMEGEAGAALPLHVQALWATEFARSRLMALDANALPATQRAVALCRQLGDPLELNAALVARVRVQQDGPEYDTYCAELVAHNEQHPDLPLRARLATQGALAVAAGVRQDLQGMIDTRSAERELAREAGMLGMVDAIETNLVTPLLLLQRWDDALALTNGLLARLADQPESYNLPWTWRGHVGALVGARRLDEARRILPEALASVRQHDLPILDHFVAQFAAREGRYEDAALLLGHALQMREDHGVSVTWDLEGPLAEAQRVAEAALGGEQVAALMARGRQLGTEAAAALACRAP